MNGYFRAQNRLQLFGKIRKNCLFLIIPLFSLSDNLAHQLFHDFFCLTHRKLFLHDTFRKRFLSIRIRKTQNCSCMSFRQLTGNQHSADIRFKLQKSQ